MHSTVSAPFEECFSCDSAAHFESLVPPLNHICYKKTVMFRNIRSQRVVMLLFICWAFSFWNEIYTLAVLKHVYGGSVELVCIGFHGLSWWGQLARSLLLCAKSFLFPSFPFWDGVHSSLKLLILLSQPTYYVMYCGCRFMNASLLFDLLKSAKK